MKPRRGWTLTSTAASLVLWLADPAAALIIADHPDDICAPAADPCVVSDRVRVLPPGLLDFGLRTVHVTGSGRFEQTTIISCGAFLVDVGAGKTAAKSNNGSGDAGTFSVTARRACSGDGTTPCLDDTVCITGSLGVCSVGAGAIDVDGNLVAQGGPGGTIRLRAAGDITADGMINVSSVMAATEGGVAEIESLMGSVDLESLIRGNAGAPGQYFGEPDGAGEAMITAAIDVRIAGRIELSGGQYAGHLRIHAGRDVIIENDIVSNAGGMTFGEGGGANIDAGRDIRMVSGSTPTRIQLNGGAQTAYYGGAYAGPGGYADLTAGNDIDLDQFSIIESRSPIGHCESAPYGGDIYLIAGDQTRVNGDIFSKGGGSCGGGGKIRLQAGNRVLVDEHSEIDAASRWGGEVELISNGTTEIRGLVNVRGTPSGYLYYGGPQPGFADIKGNADLTVSGSILGGADDGWSLPDMRIDVCRVTVEEGGRIDDSFGGADGGGSIHFIIGESMTIEAGSEITTNPLVGAKNHIRYRDPDKPPVLLGDVTPAPVLVADPSIPGCPVCGNSEIDEGESCDDGNTTSGDNCRDDCQDEGCIAQTPGYPGVSLCDDGDACTIDECDPTAHACVNTPSCEEGIACTVDACVSGACQHTPDNAACDDGNECTADTCSATTGCTFVNQAGSCEDDDICTQTGSCSFGRCVAVDTAYTVKHKLSLRFGSAANEDRVLFKAQMPQSLFASDPTVTGLTLRLQDALDGEILHAFIPAAEFASFSGGTRFSFRDDGSIGSARGIRSVDVRLSAPQQVYKVKVKGRDMDLSQAEDQARLTLSLLWGTDPATDDCLTARRVPCTSKSGRLSCQVDA